MKPISNILVLGLLLVEVSVLTGCSQKKDPPHYQRFLPITNPDTFGGPAREVIPWHGFFALDTKTGQLCRTTAYGLQSFQGLPECVVLLQKYPD
jgi:hypothetical protein